MNFQKTEDIFLFSVPFKNDTIFVEIKDIIYSLMYALVNNIDIVGKYSLLMKTNDDSFNVSNAGNCYNTLFLTNNFELTDEEFTKISLSFRNVLNNNSKFKMLVSKIPDSINLIVFFTKYLYIPVRLDFNSIPDGLKIKYCKQYIMTLCILFNNNYIEKYISTLPELDIYKRCWESLLKNNKIDENICANMKRAATYEVLKNNCLVKPKESDAQRRGHPTHVFYNYMFNLLITISLEIIKKFCPNYYQCKEINPKYDGSWVSPLDDDVNVQISQIQGIIN